MKTIIIVLVAGLLICLKISGQDILINNHFFLKDRINPASFIQSNDLNAFLLYKNEFSGFDQQPNVYTFDASLVLKKNKIGINLFADDIGQSIYQNINIRYARQFFISQYSFFTLGLSSGVLRHRLKRTQMHFENPDDPLSYSDYSTTRFDFSFGAEYNHHDKLFAGISVNHLQSCFSRETDTDPFVHYYGYLYFMLAGRNAFVFYPNFLLRYRLKKIWVDAGMNVFYKNKVWLGTYYTINHDLTVNAGIRIKSDIMFGYAYKTSLKSDILQPLRTNTHEIFLNFIFNKNNIIIKTPRFID